MSYVYPAPLRASKAAVSTFAEDVARRLKYEVGEDMWGFVSRIGGRISFNDEVRPHEDVPESIIVQPSGDFQIFLPTVTTSERDRFTIAHELGHLFLHFPKVRDQYPGRAMAATRRVDLNNEDQQRAEWEANWFAASFLMPECEFRDTHAVLARDIISVAAKFGVSQKAADIRAKTLGLDRG